jgi:dihydroneopterin aldolase
MTRLLVSVQDENEALVALEGGAAIIDFKDPSAGALGALPAPVITEALGQLRGRAVTSATAGDWPLNAKAITPAVMRTGATGVDYVKIGLLPGEALESCVEALAPAAARYRLIAVFFADRGVPLGILRALHAAHFAGAMIDTFDKSAGGLRRHMGDGALEAFVDTALSFDLYTGLAGSLRVEDISALTPLAPHFLGFRGAVCEDARRGGALSAQRLRLVAGELERTRVGRATAAASSLSRK